MLPRVVVVCAALLLVGWAGPVSAQRPSEYSWCNYYANIQIQNGYAVQPGEQFMFVRQVVALAFQGNTADGGDIQGVFNDPLLSVFYDGLSPESFYRNTSGNGTLTAGPEYVAASAAAGSTPGTASMPWTTGATDSNMAAGFSGLLEKYTTALAQYGGFGQDSLQQFSVYPCVHQTPGAPQALWPPPPPTQNLRDIHRNMHINQTMISRWTSYLEQAVNKTIISYDVDGTVLQYGCDIDPDTCDRFRKLFRAFGRSLRSGPSANLRPDLQICNQPDCDCAHNWVNHQSGGLFPARALAGEPTCYQQWTDYIGKTVRDTRLTQSTVQPMCIWYTAAQAGKTPYRPEDEVATIRAVVERAVLGGAATGQVNGTVVVGIVNDPLQAAFFNGSVQYRGASTPNFVAGYASVDANDTNRVAYVNLMNHLTQWFSGALGCWTYNTTGNPAYTGASMTAVHAGMQLTPAVFSAFIGQVRASAESLGFTTADGAILAALLGSFTRPSQRADGSYVPLPRGTVGTPAGNVVCNQPGCACSVTAGYTGAECRPVVAPNRATQSMCDYYMSSIQLSPYSLVDAAYFVGTIVDRFVLGGVATGLSDPSVVPGILSFPNIARFFNGSVQFRANGTTPNFLAGSPAGNNEDFRALSKSLVVFFKTALNCTVHPPYTGKTMTAAHAGMKIDRLTFDQFNGQVVASAASFGFTAADQALLRALLSSYTRPSQKADGSFVSLPPSGAPGNPADNIVCNQPDCLCAVTPGYTGAECRPAVAANRTVQSMCDFYMSSIQLSPYSLVDAAYFVGTIVDRAVLGGAAVPGALSFPSIVRFFNGSVQFRANGTTPNFLAGSPAGNNEDFRALSKSLVVFFKTALNCTVHPPYTGKSMTDAHRGMNIDRATFDAFNGQIVASAASFGFTADDQATLRAMLSSFTRAPQNIDGSLVNAADAQNQICVDPFSCPCRDPAYTGLECRPKVAANRATQTICDFYVSNATGSPYSAKDANRFVRGVVRSALGRVTADSALSAFFDGSINYRAGGVFGAGGTVAPNFAANASARLVLEDHLTQYFANPAVLNCTATRADGSLPPYAGVSNMQKVHGGMSITKAVFTQFNGHVAASASFSGMTTADVTLVGGVLASFGRALNATGAPRATQICNQPDCDCGVPSEAPLCGYVAPPAVSSSSSTGSAGGVTGSNTGSSTGSTTGNSTSSGSSSTGAGLCSSSSGGSSNGTVTGSSSSGGFGDFATSDAARSAATSLLGVAAMLAAALWAAVY